MLDNKEKFFDISSLIAKKLSGEITEEEEKKLLKWRETSKHNKDLFDEICSETMMRGKIDTYKKAEVQSAFDSFIQKKEKMYTRRHRIRNIIRYAAILILPLLVCVLYLNRGKEVEENHELQKIYISGKNMPILTLSNGKEMILENQNLQLEEENGVRISMENGEMQYERVNSVDSGLVYNTLETPSQCDFTFILEDGTRVWMNAKSSLRYPVAFHEKERVIYAEGEIYLEVAKDKHRPFFVILDGMKVEVLGTSFNINSYADEKYTEVTLVEGRVAAYVNAQSYCLLPERQLRWDKENKIVDIKPVNVNDYIAWKNGQYVFKGKMLSEVAKVLHRWYDVEVIFKNREQEKSIYTGVINKEERIDVFIKRLNETSSFNCRLMDNCVFVE